MIISGGENLYPSQVEEALRDHPDVDDAVVSASRTADFGERLVRVRRGCDAEQRAPDDDVDRFARENLARFKVPRDVVIIATSCRATRSGRC